MASGIDFLSSLNCVYAGSPAISSVAITKLKSRSLEHCFKLLGLSVTVCVYEPNAVCWSISPTDCHFS